MFWGQTQQLLLPPPGYGMGVCSAALVLGVPGGAWSSCVLPQGIVPVSTEVCTCNTGVRPSVRSPVPHVCSCTCVCAPVHACHMCDPPVGAHVCSCTCVCAPVHACHMCDPPVGAHVCSCTCVCAPVHACHMCDPPIGAHVCSCTCVCPHTAVGSPVCTRVCANPPPCVYLCTRLHVHDHLVHIQACRWVHHLHHAGAGIFPSGSHTPARPQPAASPRKQDPQPGVSAQLVCASHKKKKKKKKKKKRKKKKKTHPDTSTAVNPARLILLFLSSQFLKLAKGGNWLICPHSDPPSVPTWSPQRGVSTWTPSPHILRDGTAAGRLRCPAWGVGGLTVSILRSRRAPLCLPGSPPAPAAGERGCAERALVGTRPSGAFQMLLASQDPGSARR
nr:uncharacterized protein LOC121471053 [Taeniopygia guttata]